MYPYGCCGCLVKILPWSYSSSVPRMCWWSLFAVTLTRAGAWWNTGRHKRTCEASEDFNICRWDQSQFTCFKWCSGSSSQPSCCLPLHFQVMWIFYCVISQWVFNILCFVHMLIFYSPLSLAYFLLPAEKRMEMPLFVQCWIYERLQ